MTVMSSFQRVKNEKMKGLCFNPVLRITLQHKGKENTLKT